MGAEGRCALAAKPGARSYLHCLGPEEFVKDVFLDSDTDMMVLSFVPSRRDAEPLTIEAADAVRRIVDRLEGTHRLMVHGRVNPNQPGDLEAWTSCAALGVCAWKTYTQFGPGGKGYFLSDDVGHALHRKSARARRQGDLRAQGPAVRQAVLRAQPVQRHRRGREALSGRRASSSITRGSSPAIRNSAYAAARTRDGIDTLMRSLVENDVAPNSNVYAELGSTWRFLMRDPEQAAHALGKLFRYCGENNVLWGTDSIWYGSPQDQIQAFRAFQISPELRAKHGYPEITPALRAKVFGLNATRPYAMSAAEVKKYIRRDRIARERLAYRERPEPHFLTYGPKTRREFLRLARAGGAG